MTLQVLEIETHSLILKKNIDKGGGELFELQEQNKDLK